METKSLSFEQMENLEGGMPCGVALGLYAVSFVSLAAATGGMVVLAAIAFGGSIWGAADACLNTLPADNPTIIIKPNSSYPNGCYPKPDGSLVCL